MWIKNLSKKSTRKVNALCQMVVTWFPELDNKDIEVHVKNVAPRIKTWGWAFGDLSPDGIATIPKRDHHYFKHIEPTTKQLAIVYTIKSPKNRAGFADDATWEEQFVCVLTHELRHLWHSRDKGEERDCNKFGKLAQEKYREYLSTRKNNS